MTYCSNDMLLTQCEIDELDPNERFLLFTVGHHVLRVLRRSPTLVDETVDVITWVLGLDVHGLADYVERSWVDGDRKRLEELLGECRIDPRCYSNVFRDHLRGTTPAAMSDAIGEVIRRLEHRLKRLGRAMDGTSCLEERLASFRRAFDLSELELALYLFLLIIDGFTVAQNFFTSAFGCTVHSGRRNLAAALDCSIGDLSKATRGPLFQNGILIKDRWDGLRVSDDFLVSLGDPSEGFLPEHHFRPLEAEELSLEAHDVGGETVEHLLRLLRGETTKRSTHILLHGEPGTGKSSFAGALVAETGLDAYEIPVHDGNTTAARRVGIISCLGLKNEGKGTVIVVDEADAVLNTRTSWLVRGETQDKGWLTQFMERGGARIVWITNQIDHIEPAVRRRFAFSLQLKPLGRMQRMHLWDRVLRRRKIKRFFHHDDIQALAAQYRVSAGAIDLAVSKTVDAGISSRSEASQSIKLSLEAHRSLIDGTASTRKGHEQRSVKGYALEALNVDVPVMPIIERLTAFVGSMQRNDTEERGAMSLLFYGPPGTGKTALGRYFAEKLDLELMVKRASDILDPYVGMTERRIARAFAEAEREGAVLMIDEVDSLLYRREHAVRSWEVSFTSELLAQMEVFQGVMICTTNRFEALDPASVRRFNEKVGFDMLTSTGNIILYEAVLADLVKTAPDALSRSRLRDVSGLTPGDFKVVRDQHRFIKRESLSHSKLIEALAHEAELKVAQRGSKRIGF